MFAMGPAPIWDVPLTTSMCSLAEVPVPKAATARHNLIARPHALIDLGCHDGNLQGGHISPLQTPNFAHLT
jgi:ubiquitin C-terminal hydrolase